MSTQTCGSVHLLAAIVSGPHNLSVTHNITAIQMKRIAKIVLELLSDEVFVFGVLPDRRCGHVCVAVEVFVFWIVRGWLKK